MIDKLLVKAYVTKADGAEVRVKTSDKSIAVELENIGFVYESDVSEYKIAVKDNQEKADFFDKLRSKDVCFSGGREWCPSEVFEYLREKNLVKGGFKQVVWKSPTDSIVRVL